MIADPLDTNSQSNYTLKFPSQSYNGHTMDRWEIYGQYFTFVGRFGDQIGYSSLPEDLKTASVANYFGVLQISSGVGTVVCGSSGEVANDPTKDELFRFRVDDTVSDSSQRSSLFHMTVLQNSDQLRQRMAWALSQIFPIGPNSVGDSQTNEDWLNYYDIFVRNAFGNYFDVLKQVAFSPMMGEMLSYRGSRSTELYKSWYNITVNPDENFAREIMQLMTIGLVKLNMDGTPVLDINGNAVQTYTIDDIVAGARAWTGFDNYPARANLESSTSRVDPMKITASYRDRFPKLNLYDGYHGDGYPLCAQLPSKPFLRIGAKYQILGSSSLPELQYYRSTVTTPYPDQSHVWLSSNSQLFQLLCAKSGVSCTFPTIVTLQSDLNCTGIECNLDTLSVVQLSGYNISYEYIRIPCVEQTIVPNAVKVQHPYGRYVCTDRRLPIAQTGCCYFSGYLRRWSLPSPCKYVSEVMTYDTAMKRCSDLGVAKNLTSNYYFLCEYGGLGGYNNTDTDPNNDDICLAYRWHFWSNETCNVNIKINLNSGKISVIHQSNPIDTSDSSFIPWDYLGNNTVTWFSVAWVNQLYPTSCLSPCFNFTGYDGNGGCVCPTVVTESPVFTSQPADLTLISSANLFVGSLAPSRYGSGAYGAMNTWTSGNIVRKYWIPTGGTISDVRTIFQVVEKGVTKYFMNMKSMVSVTVGSATYSFRNPVQFHTMQDLQLRDALYETDALLEHLFYHDNTAPFVSFRIIQRFGISNPSPRYVKVVATAFTQGNYTSGGQTFGSGKYGDLAATVAAVLLDREAREPILDADPVHGSLKEPLLRVLQFMRAMEFKSNVSLPLVLFESMDVKIGQQAYGFPSIFSFFLPEYKPPGVLSLASLRSPESYVLNTPTALGLASGLISLVKYGLRDCQGGFGENVGCPSKEGDYSNSWGQLGYTPANYSSSAIIDNLALLLTPGRLNADNRNVILQALSNASLTNSSKLRLAQQLFCILPEYNSNGVVQMNGTARPSPPSRNNATKPYKAIVYFFLEGGADTFNLLVPYGNCAGTDMYAQYQTVRSTIALPKSKLLQIDATGSGQVCNTFGIHNKLPYLKFLYDNQTAAFLANTGVLMKYSTPKNYIQNNPTELFAHNVMQQESKLVDPFDHIAGTGVLGRMLTLLSKKAYQGDPVSVNGQASVLQGETGISPSVIFLSSSGASTFNPNPSIPNMQTYLNTLNNASKMMSNLYGETWSSVFTNGVSENANIMAAMNSFTLLTSNTWVRDTTIEKQLSIAAQLIGSAAARKTERDAFYVSLGGFDTHADVATNLDSLYDQVNQAIEGFVKEMITTISTVCC